MLWASSIATVLFVWIPLGIVAQRLLRTLRSAQLAGPNARVDTSVDTEEFEPPAELKVRRVGVPSPIRRYGERERSNQSRWAGLHGRTFAERVDSA